MKNQLINPKEKEEENIGTKNLNQNDNYIDNKNINNVPKNLN